MRLINTNRPIDLAEIGSQTDLVASLTGLVDRVSAIAEEAGSQVADEIQHLVSRAMTAAHASEESLSDMRERINFLERLATTDEMTGLMNRRGFETALDQALSQASRYHETGILAYIDLDGFKPINDTLGHAAGDAVLRHVAKLLRENTRGADFVGRLGGDEFGLVLVRSDWDQGLKRIEHIDRLLNNARLTWGAKVIRIQASIGVQAYEPDHKAFDLLSQADEAMYRTKRGRSGSEGDANEGYRGYG